MFDKLLGKKQDPLDAAHKFALHDLPRDWETVWLQVECEHAGARTSVDRFVATQSAPKPTYVKSVDPKAFDVFAALSEESTPRWTTLTLRYDRVGSGAPNVKAEFGYDPVPADYRHERRLAWKKAHFPAEA